MKRYIIKWAFIVAGYLVYIFAYKFWLTIVDGISRVSGRSTQLAVCAPIELEEFVGDEDGRDVEVELRRDLKQSRCRRRRGCRRGGRGEAEEDDARLPCITVNVKWVPSELPSADESSACQICQIPPPGCAEVGDLKCHQEGHRWDYDAASGYGMLVREGFEVPISVISNAYDPNRLVPRGNADPPPVRTIKAIYGVNLPTEVSAIYRRRKTLAERKGVVRSKFELDKNVRKDIDGTGYEILDGVVLETRETPQRTSDGRTSRCSGDGTVPYWSLQFVNEWRGKADVTVTEIEGAEHRAILADARFQRELIEYVTAVAEEAGENAV